MNRKAERISACTAGRGWPSNQDAGVFCQNMVTPCQDTGVLNKTSAVVFGRDARPNPYQAFPQFYPQVTVWNGVAQGNGINIYDCKFAPDGTARYDLDKKIMPIAETLYRNQGCNGYSFNPYPFTNRTTKIDDSLVIGKYQQDGAPMCLRQY